MTDPLDFDPFNRGREPWNPPEPPQWEEPPAWEGWLLFFCVAFLVAMSAIAALVRL